MDVGLNADRGRTFDRTCSRGDDATTQIRNSTRYLRIFSFTDRTNIETISILRVASVEWISNRR